MFWFRLIVFFFSIQDIHFHLLSTSDQWIVGFRDSGQIDRWTDRLIDQ